MRWFKATIGPSRQLNQNENGSYMTRLEITFSIGDNLKVDPSWIIAGIQRDLHIADVSDLLDIREIDEPLANEDPPPITYERAPSDIISYERKYKNLGPVVPEPLDQALENVLNDPRLPEHPE